MKKGELNTLKKISTPTEERKYGTQKYGCTRGTKT